MFLNFLSEILPSYYSLKVSFISFSKFLTLSPVTAKHSNSYNIVVDACICLSTCTYFSQFIIVTGFAKTVPNSRTRIEIPFICWHEGDLVRNSSFRSSHARILLREIKALHTYHQVFNILLITLLFSYLLWLGWNDTFQSESISFCDLVKYQKWLIDQVFPDGALSKTASKA